MWFGSSLFPISTKATVRICNIVNTTNIFTYFTNAPTSTGVPVIEFHGLFFLFCDPGRAFPFQFFQLSSWGALNSLTGKWGNVWTICNCHSSTYRFNMVFTENLTVSSCAVEVDGPSLPCPAMLCWRTRMF